MMAALEWQRTAIATTDARAEKSVSYIDARRVEIAATSKSHPDVERNPNERRCIPNRRFIATRPANA